LKETSALEKKDLWTRVEVETVFDDVFRECIVSSRKQREGLYRNLVAMFERVEPPEKESEPSSVKKKSRSRISFGLEASSSGSDSALLSFDAQVLVYLPYTSAGDPLFLQYHITSIVALQGPQLLDRLTAFLRDYGLASGDELDEANADEDAVSCLYSDAVCVACFPYF
jgi:Sister chromatid cohesion C-terminus